MGRLVENSGRGLADGGLRFNLAVWRKGTGSGVNRESCLLRAPRRTIDAGR